MYAAAATVAFLLELAALAALAYWGARAADGAWAWVLAVGTPLAAAVVWGLFAAPRARFPLSAAATVSVRLAVLLGSAAALAVAGRHVLAFVLALVVAADTIVLAALGRPVAGSGAG